MKINKSCHLWSVIPSSSLCTLSHHIKLFVNSHFRRGVWTSTLAWPCDLPALYPIPTPLSFFANLCFFFNLDFLENPIEQAGGLIIWRTEPLLYFPSHLPPPLFFSEMKISKNLDFLESSRKQADGWTFWRTDLLLHSQPLGHSHYFFGKVFFKKSRFFETFLTRGSVSL